MTREEYIKKIQKYYDDHKLKEADSYGEGYNDVLSEALDYAIFLSGKLCEPNKVVIPQFVADWIENDLDYVWEEPINIVHRIVEDGDCGPRGEWLDDIDNQKLLLNAIANGYKVKKESKYRIKLPGLAGSNGQQYISKSADGKLFACAYRDYLQQEFTNNELKQLPDWVRRLEFEEVEND